MAFSISGYTDPGSYIEEVVQPGAVAVSSERVLCIVAIAPRTRRYSNEAVIRGKVSGESLTGFALVGTNYEKALTNTGNRDRNNAVLYKNSNAEAIGRWSFAPAKLTGNAVAGAAMDTTTEHKFTLSMDGKDPVTLTLTTKGAGTALTTIATELNAALALVAAYGATYNAVFTTATGAVADDTLVITSPITTAASDIKIFLSYEDIAVTYEDMASTVSNAAWAPTKTVGVQATTDVRIPALYYDATATYTIDYVSVDTQTDALTNADATTPLSDLVSIGSYPNADTYLEDTDFEDTGNTVDWYIAATTAQATLSGKAGPYAIVLNTNDHLGLSINGLTTIDITLSAGGAQTAAAVAEDIALALNASTTYGPDYCYVSSDAAGTIKLDAPGQFENYPVSHGAASSLTLVAPAAYDASTTLFNVTTAQLPYSVYGTGSRPGFATTYYCTYDVTRASTDYDEPTRVYNADQLFTYTSPLTSSNYTTNILGVAGEIAFENYAPSLWLQQVNDSTTPGSPTPTQIQTAIENCEKKAGITDIVVIDTSEAQQAYLMGHVSNMSTLTEKKYRRGWYGCARDTAIGDPDTTDTILYRTSRTVQPTSTSTGRGRQIMLAPTKATRTLTLEDGSEVDVNLDGSYIATAVAALQTSLPSPSSTMVNRTIRGFKTDSTFETYLKSERHTLASNGVCVVTSDAGNLILKDPLTTEQGGVVQFEEPMSSCQKDAVTNVINTLLGANVVGLVPDDLADFISDVKTWIMLGIQASINAGDIAPFRDNNNVIRDIDLTTDIQVWQDTTDPRIFLFNYWFNLKYPAKRFFGQHSVDNPFFSPTT